VIEQCQIGLIDSGAIHCWFADMYHTAVINASTIQKMELHAIDCSRLEKFSIENNTIDTIEMVAIMPITARTFHFRRNTVKRIDERAMVEALQWSDGFDFSSNQIGAMGFHRAWFTVADRNQSKVVFANGIDCANTLCDGLPRDSYLHDGYFYFFNHLLNTSTCNKTPMLRSTKADTTPLEYVQANC